MVALLAMLPPEKFMVKDQRLANKCLSGAARSADHDASQGVGEREGEGVSAADELVRALRPIEQGEASKDEANSLYCVLKALCKIGGNTHSRGHSSQLTKAPIQEQS